MAGRRSRSKGRRGEYGFRDLARMFGFDARRGVASAGEPDQVHNIPGTHVEVKNVERLDLWAAIQQAERDAKPGEVPWVAFTRNHQPYRVIMPAEEALRLKRLESIVEEFTGLAKLVGPLPEEGS